MGILAAQDFVEPLPTPQAARVYSELLPSGLDDRYDGEGLLYGLRAFTTYDSNIFLSAAEPEGALSVNLSPWAHYSSAPPGGAEWILNGRYSPFFRWFLGQDELNSIDHTGEISLSHEGPVIDLRTGVGYSRISGASRFLEGGRFTNERFSFDFLGSYFLSDRSALQLQLSSGSFSLSTSDTQIYLAQLTGFWLATPLVRVGPSVRYATRDSSTTGDVRSVGLLVSAAYEFSELVDVLASMGIEQIEQASEVGEAIRVTGSLSARYSSPDRPWSARVVIDYGAVQQFAASNRFGAGGESPWTARVILRYEFARFWAADLSMRYESFPSPSTVGISIEDLTVGAGVTRRVGTSRWGARVSMSRADYTVVGSDALIDDQTTLSGALSHRIGILAERFYVDSSLRYTNNQGRGGNWSRWQISTGFNFIF